MEMPDKESDTICHFVRNTALCRAGAAGMTDLQHVCNETGYWGKQMRDRIRSKQRSKYVVLVVLFLLIVTISLGYMLERQSRSSIITLMQTRMLDTANTAAAMINGDVLKSVTPEDYSCARSLKQVNLSHSGYIGGIINCRLYHGQ